jgi:penicillin amidase
MKILRLVLLGLLLMVVVVVTTGGVLINRWTRGPLPDAEGTVQITGLFDTVEIIRDEYGVPHIYASRTYDLRFAQGYVQAQDRWWQMEFARHAGRGTLQELTGKTDSLMGTDIFIRTAGWRRAAENDLANLPEEVITELQAFADGVNAYITSRSAGQLAFEYNILGMTGVDIPIVPWTPLDTLVWTKVMADDLGGNYSDELAHAEMIAALGEDMIADYWMEYPYDQHPTIIQPEDFPTPDETAASDNNSAGIVSLYSQLAGNYDASQGLIFGKGDGIGSNNWVVSGALTESGMPMLANDPHLGIGMPSIWYEIGLHCEPVSDECPYNVRGFTFPATAGIVIGHNEHIGWGVTNVGWDTQDLYRITVNPENPLQYEWNGEWRDMTVHEEVINFGDGEPSVTIQVRETHLGPILNDNQIDEQTGEILGFNNEDPIAFHWTSYEPSTIYYSIMLLNRAQNWDEFREALRLWDAPSQNFVYADVEGNIGYQTPGNVPVRAAGHTGKLPVDGSTDEFEWRGYVPFDLLPSVFNPERGYIETANQALVPLSYYDYLASELTDTYGEDANYIFDYSWDIGYRGQRIVEMLAATDQHNFDTFSAIQGDNKFLMAEAIAPTLASVDMGSEALNEARDWMREWDYQLHMDSPQAALFMHFWRQLMMNLYEDQLGEVSDPGGGGSNKLATTLLMDDPENIWWDDTTTEAVETRDAIIVRSFSEAYDAAVAQFGDERSTWSWGAMHTSMFVSNPLGLSGIDIIENTVNFGPVATSGGSDIVNATSWRFSSDADVNSFAVRSVPSMRMILDFSDLSNSQTIHTTGQSGHPMSEHYSDFVDAWRNIEYHPMSWTREQVESSAANTLILQPE